MSLLERSLAITHDMGLSSIAFPLIGAGINKYPATEVIKAILDACSLFRQKVSPLKKIVIVVWKHDHKNQQVCSCTQNLIILLFQSKHFQSKLSKPYIINHSHIFYCIRLLRGTVWLNSVCSDLWGMVILRSSILPQITQILQKHLDNLWGETEASR